MDLPSGATVNRVTLTAFPFNLAVSSIVFLSMSFRATPFVSESPL
jgi:hypothetical protein